VNSWDVWRDNTAKDGGCPDRNGVHVIAFSRRNRTSNGMEIENRWYRNIAIYRIDWTVQMSSVRAPSSPQDAHSREND
jgi:hypothetical protein